MDVNAATQSGTSQNTVGDSGGSILSVSDIILSNVLYAPQAEETKSFADIAESKGYSPEMIGLAIRLGASPAEMENYMDNAAAINNSLKNHV
jgi:hypothetical protein